VVLVDLGVRVLAPLARRWRQRRCYGISPPGLSLAPLVFHSDATGEPVEEELLAWSACTGVRPRFFFVSCGRRRYETFVLGLQSRLGFLWAFGGWICLGLSSAAAVVDGDRRSRGCKGLDETPVDGRQLTAFSIATPTKAMARRGLCSSRWSSSSSAAVMVAAGVGIDGGSRRIQGPGCNFFFLGSFA